VPSNAAKIAADETQHQVVTDTNGVIPVIIGEYGNSTDGNNVDPGWQATITAVNTTPDGEGSLAWNWDANGTQDQVQNSCFDGTSLIAYGQLVAQYIASGPSHPLPPAKSGPIDLNALVHEPLVDGEVRGSEAANPVSPLPNAEIGGVGHCLRVVGVGRDMSGNSEDAQQVSCPCRRAGGGRRYDRACRCTCRRRARPRAVLGSDGGGQSVADITDDRDSIRW
jgi:hypothetical protein